MLTSTALQAKSLKKVYKIDNSEIHAVEDVSFTLQTGEFIALVGPSGSGKTTILALLAGLLRPDEGKVFIKAQDLSQMKDSRLTAFRRQNIGFTFQANNLLPYLTVMENVELMLDLNGKDNRKGKERARELLNHLGLEERLKNLPAQLSGGEQQRVAIARAMVHDPEIVLMDEPTASLDTTRAYQVIDTFARLIHEQNRSGIMVTHDLRICAYADRILVMEDGRIERSISSQAEIETFAKSPESTLRKVL
jgi:putative ABC transport system ATP-binding protein